VSRIIVLGLVDQLYASFQILNHFKYEPGGEGVVQILEILEFRGRYSRF